ncbi:MAG: hypothetical protein KAY24_16355 [Candidatus Eisenbacteria sp.]|nr:hypothetical protein [Candidatus Eisenbacteria bacterium]
MQGYRELVFEGSLPVVQAFLTGLRLGKRWAGGICFSEECEIRGERRGHKVLERLHIEKNLTYVLVPERCADAVVLATRAARGELGLAIRRDHVVQHAHFTYKFAGYNRKVAGRIRKALRAMPSSLERDAAKENERIHPGSHGVEGYAPEHEYKYAGTGMIKGPLEPLLAYRKSLARLEWIEVTEIGLLLV